MTKVCGRELDNFDFTDYTGLTYEEPRYEDDEFDIIDDYEDWDEDIDPDEYHERMMMGDFDLYDNDLEVLIDRALESMDDWDEGGDY